MPNAFRCGQHRTRCADKIPAARTPASAPTTRPKTLPIAFSAINDSPSCPAPIAQHNAAQRSTSQHLFFTTAPSEHITPRRFLPPCIDSLLRAGKSLTLSASAFFFSSLCPPSAAFNFNLKTCWFIRVGGTSDMVAFLFSGKCCEKVAKKSRVFPGSPLSSCLAVVGGWRNQQRNPPHFWAKPSRRLGRQVAVSTTSCAV